MVPGAGGKRAGAAAEGARSVAVAGDVVDSVIVTGDNATIRLDVGGAGGALLNLVSGLGISKEPRPTPLDVRPGPFAGHVDRDDEAASVLADARGGLPLTVHGEAGIGKTYVLLHALADDGARSLRDGSVYLFGKGTTREDLLQELFEEFYDCRPVPYKASASELKRSLADRKALVVLDSLGLETDEAQALVVMLPGCALVLAARERSLWEGASLRVGELAPEHAVGIVEQELGRTLSTDERAVAEKLSSALAGHPQRIRQTAAHAREEGRPLDEVVSALGERKPVPTWTAAMLASLSAEETRVLEALAPFGTESVGREHIARLAALSDPKGALEVLERRRLIESGSPRYSLAATLAADPPASWDVRGAAVRALAHFAGWMEEHRGETSRQLQEATAVVELLRRWAAVAPAQAVAVGRAVDAALAAGRRFGAWGETIELVLAAALASGDWQAEAWALHQRGTRAACEGDAEAAAGDLGRALELRARIGNEVGVAATRHNLRQLRRGPPWFLRFPFVVLALLAVVLIGVGGGYAVSSLVGDDDQRRASLTIAKEGEGDGIVESTPAGVDCGAACTAEFKVGAEVELMAVPARGSLFAGWEADGCAGTGPCVVRLDHARTVTARFQRAPPGRHTLTVTSGGDGEGTVTSTPAGIDCGNECSADFAADEVVVLEAVPEPGSRFAVWRGSCSGTGSCRLELDRDHSVEAVFERSADVVLTVTREGDGSGTVTSDPTGIDCGDDCSSGFPSGSTVTLTARADEGSAFAGWSGGCSGIDPCVIVLGAATSVTARFDRSTMSRTLRVVQGGDGEGTVTSGPSGIDCGGECEASFEDGTAVTLTAVPGQGARFDGWRGADCGTAPTCELTLEADATVTAFFRKAPEEHVLTVAPGGSGEGTVTSDPAGISCGSTCSAPFAAQTVVVLSAEPERGSAFAGWSGACAGTGSCQVTIEGATTVKVSFVRLVSLTVVVSGDGIVTSKPRGLFCRANMTCTRSFSEGSLVALLPRPGTGWYFENWDGDCTGARRCSVRLNAARTVTAVFRGIVE